jgi:hypothetical protein
VARKRRLFVRRTFRCNWTSGTCARAAITRWSGKLANDIIRARRGLSEVLLKPVAVSAYLGGGSACIALRYGTDSSEMRASDMGANHF